MISRMQFDVREIEILVLATKNESQPFSLPSFFKYTHLFFITQLAKYEKPISISLLFCEDLPPLAIALIFLFCQNGDLGMPCFLDLACQNLFFLE